MKKLFKYLKQYKKLKQEVIPKRETVWDKIMGKPQKKDYYYYKELVQNIINVSKKSQFENYKLYQGHQTTKGIILSINILIYLLWQMEDDLILQQKLKEYFKRCNTSYYDYDGNLVPQKYFPNVFLSLFSHQQTYNFLTNMFIFMMLTRRLHQFLGWERFLFLYFGGGITGAWLTNVTGYLDPEFVKTHEQTRYLNLMKGQDPGYLVYTGASDATMALIAAFFFIFPRHQLYTNFLTYSIKLKNFQQSAVWLLPFFFMKDFVQLLSERNGPYPGVFGGYTMGNVGGFLWGTLFYLFVGKILKKKYHPDMFEYDFSKICQKISALAMYGILFYTYQVYTENKIKKGTTKDFFLEFYLDPNYQKQLENTKFQTFDEKTNKFENIYGNQIINKIQIAQECHINKNPRDNYTCDELYKNVNKLYQKLESRDKYQYHNHLYYANTVGNTKQYIDRTLKVIPQEMCDQFIVKSLAKQILRFNTFFIKLTINIPQFNYLNSQKYINKINIQKLRQIQQENINKMKAKQNKYKKKQKKNNNQNLSHQEEVQKELTIKEKILQFIDKKNDTFLSKINKFKEDRKFNKQKKQQTQEELYKCKQQQQYEQRQQINSLNNFNINNDYQQHEYTQCETGK